MRLTIACLTSIATYNKFKKFEARIMVTTDLGARGLDIERVNIVFNYDFPIEADTYTPSTHTQHTLHPHTLDSTPYTMYPLQGNLAHDKHPPRRTLQ